MKQILIILSLLLLIPFNTCLAIDELDDAELGMITAQDGITVILEDFKVTHRSGLMAIGGTDGLGIPEAPDGAWFVFDSTRIMELDVEKGALDIDAFTTGTTGLDLGGNGYHMPDNASGALVNFGEAYFHINMTDAIITLKFANNPNGFEGDGVTTFSQTVCHFAVNGSTVTVKSDDAKMYIFSH